MRTILLYALWIASIGLMNAQHQVRESFSNVTDLQVEGLFCDVNILVWNSDHIEFSGKLEIEPSNDQIKIKYSQSGNQVKVWVETPKHCKGNYHGEFVFKIPSSTNVFVNNVSGDILAKSLAGSHLTMKTVSGDISLQSIESDLVAESVSGDMTIIQVEGALQCNTVSGDVEVNQVDGTLQVSSISGDLNIKKIMSGCTSSTVSGDINSEDVRTYFKSSSTSGTITGINLQGEIKCNNTSGNLVINNATGIFNCETLNGSITGETIRLMGESKFKSFSGDISLLLTNSESELSFDLNSFSGRIEAKGIQGKDRLKMQKGTILIKGETFSGNQKYL